MCMALENVARQSIGQFCLFRMATAWDLCGEKMEDL